MSLINYSTREISCKVVYYGPGLGGKTTNVQYVYGRIRPETKGRLVSLATEMDRTLFFDFLPLDLGPIKGFRTRFHLYTVPGLGVLRRQPAIDPAWCRRRRVRGRFTHQPFRGQRRELVQPARELGAARSEVGELAVRGCSTTNATCATSSGGRSAGGVEPDALSAFRSGGHPGASGCSTP